MDLGKLWEMERSFWLDGPAFYEASMAPDACMVFPAPVGILSGPRIIDGLRQASRWNSVDFDNRTKAESDNTVVLAYKAIGRRDGEEPYAAYCASTYVRRDDAWILLAHQQTPNI